MTREYFWNLDFDAAPHDSGGSKTLASVDVPTLPGSQWTLERIIVAITVGFAAYAENTFVLPDQRQAVVQGDLVLRLFSFPASTPSNDTVWRRDFFLPVAPVITAQLVAGIAPLTTTYLQVASEDFDGDVTVRRTADDNSTVNFLMGLDTPIQNWTNVDRDPIPPRVTARWNWKVLWSREAP